MARALNSNSPSPPADFAVTFDFVVVAIDCSARNFCLVDGSSLFGVFEFHFKQWFFGIRRDDARYERNTVKYRESISSHAGHGYLPHLWV